VARGTAAGFARASESERKVRRLAVSVLALLFVVMHADRAVAQPSRDDPSASDAEVFDRVFQHRPARARAPTALVVNGENRGPIVVDLPADSSPLAPAAPLIAALGPKLQASTRAALVAAVRERRISIGSLRSLGLDAAYDPRRLELRIAIPERLMETTSHGLQATGAPPETAGALPPSELSGYLNLRAGGGRTVASEAHARDQDPLHVALDAAINARAWVIEARVDVGDAPSGVHRVHRGDVLVSHDDTERALRWLAGDFAVPGAGLQPGYATMGVGVTRNFALQPYRALQPVGKLDFVLDRPSRVTVLVNNVAVRTLWLPAGRHDIRDLPLGAGTSAVELSVRDDRGVERRLAFSATDPGELLAPGIAQLTLGIGFPLIADAGLRVYDFARPTVSTRRRWGVTPSSTFGGSLDAQIDRQLAGGSLLHVTPLGSVAVDLAASHDGATGAGHAEGLRYDLARSTAALATETFSVVAHHYSPRFCWLAMDAAAERYSGDVAVSAARALTDRLFGRLTARYSLGRNSPGSIDAAVGLSRSFAGLEVDASLGFRSHTETASEGRLFVSARWSLPRRGGSLRARSQTTTNGDTTREVGYAHGASGFPGGLATSVSLRESAETVAAHGEAQYTGQRFTSSLSTTSSVGRGELAQATSIELATALVFAGGRATWSRPITGSFAIVAPNDSVAGFPIGVNRAPSGYAARTDDLGLAVIPSLEAYRVGVIRVESPTLPVGYSLGPSSYKVLPAYKSGTLIRVGERGTLSLRGTLRLHGAAVAFAIGELVSLDDSTLPAFVVMSNRAGRFAVTGLIPGRYELRLEQRAARLTIPPDATGVVSADVDVE
jgi:outer membrane usher protein